MSTRVRQLIFFVVFTLSVLGLVALLLYSAGYRFDYSTWRLQATGSIRVAVDVEEDVLILLLPTGNSSSAAQTSFTHLLPGAYHLYLEAPGYQTINLELTVQPKETIIIDPVRLWPVLEPERMLVNTAPLQTTSITDLPISLQAAVSKLGISSQQAKWLLIDQRTLVVLDQTSDTLQLLTQNGTVIETRGLGSAQDIQRTDSDTQLLLIDQFGLQTIDLETNTVKTITRLSTPITTATWIAQSPYIAYATASAIHIIDTREQTNYYDQLLTPVSAAVSDLSYDLTTDRLRFLLADKPYTSSLRLDK